MDSEDDMTNRETTGLALMLTPFIIAAMVLVGILFQTGWFVGLAALVVILLVMYGGYLFCTPEK